MRIVKDFPRKDFYVALSFRRNLNKKFMTLNYDSTDDKIN